MFLPRPVHLPAVRRVALLASRRKPRLARVHARAPSLAINGRSRRTNKAAVQLIFYTRRYFPLIVALWANFDVLRAISMTTPFIIL